jgi:hypothetical protein
MIKADGETIEGIPMKLFQRYYLHWHLCKEVRQTL